MTGSAEMVVDSMDKSPGGRPPLPSESIARTAWGKRGRQARALAWPWQRLLVTWQDSGWSWSSSLKRHVVICGFPRAGTTLCQLMVQSCVENVTWFPREVCGLDAAQCAPRRHPIMLTKRPRDVFLIPEINAWHQRNAIQSLFILMMRDPRAVLTSRHSAKPDQYFVSVDAWRAIYEHWRWAVGRADALEVRYEDLVRQPAAVQSRLTAVVGWHVQHPFDRFHEVARGISSDGALNGLRPPDPNNIDRWRDESHRERIKSLLSAMPELPERLIELGYENDTAWTDDYVAGSGYR